MKPHPLYHFIPYRNKYLSGNTAEKAAARDHTNAVKYFGMQDRTSFGKTQISTRKHSANCV